jgi:hypothetical protein
MEKRKAERTAKRAAAKGKKMKRRRRRRKLKRKKERLQRRICWQTQAEIQTPRACMLLVALSSCTAVVLTRLSGV